MINPRTTTARVCQICSAEFFPFRASKGWFCSNKCKFEAKKIDRTATCSGCGESFVAKKGGVKYCSNPCYQEAKKNRPLRDRLYEQINKTNYCWLWTGGTNHNGYGRIFYDNQFLLTHRALFAIETGEDIANKVVRHFECDNPPCCNPTHLKSGTMQDNTDDMTSKSRHAHGETTYSKLTEATIMAIRNDNRIHRLIAADYGIERRYVGQIKQRTVWKHVG